MSKADIKSMTLTELSEAFAALGLQKYRAPQVYKWLHEGAASFDEMTNLPKDLRQGLNEKYYIAVAETELKTVSQKDGTVKYLFRLIDGEHVESVLMKYHHGYSICISTQVGCKMGCTFCATGKTGFARNLTASEMLSQINSAEADIGGRISNIVMMGMGEPLDNYDNVIRFLRLASSEEGMNIGLRHISLSTCGIVPKIYALMEENLPITLSVSLHAPNDEIRSETMPVNGTWGIDEILAACKAYSEKTKRRISFEYAMISGRNDSDACAHELAKRLRGIHAHINLIPVNDVTGTGFKKSNVERQKRFADILEKAGYTATVRRTLGSDIEASCGQLKRKFTQGGQQNDS